MRAENQAEARAYLEEWSKRRKRKKRRRKVPKSSSLRSSPRQGCRRPRDHQRRVPAVHDVREPGGASDSVHPHTLGFPVATERQVPTVHCLQAPGAVLGHVS